MNSLPPEPGQVVFVRQRPFVVSDVRGSNLPPSGSDQGRRLEHLISLSSVEDEGLGEELQVIWEIEPGTEIRSRTGLPELQEFDPPQTFDAFLDSVAWGAVSQADDAFVQSPFRSGIEVDEYQLEPVVRALQMPRVNLLIADDVGLGKTIEAGLVAQELILRHRARSILIVCPSSIQVQWKDEMRDKFGLEFRIVDRQLMGELRRKRGIHVNPWSHFPRLITSIDFLKRERPMRLFRDTLPGGDQPSYPRPYDLLIVDECHNAAPSGRGAYAIESQRTQAIRGLTEVFEHKLFLSATPHNGYSESFSALLELLDNQRFARAIPPKRSQLEAVMVRRLKSELKLHWDGSRRFADRCVRHIEVPYTDAERQIHALLQRYTQLRSESATTAGQHFATDFVLKLLKKRLFSSPAAFASTIEKHAKSAGAGGSSGSAWMKSLASEEEWWDDEEYEVEAAAQVETASRHSHPLSAEETEVLRELRKWAEGAANRPDTKARQLIAWLHETLKPGGKWSEQRVILFTEYRATQKWLHGILAAEGFAEAGRLLTIYGGMPLDDRERIKAAFQASPADSPVRILLATDAASEGVNLQNHCHQLIHYEIPWNPNRMEQRNGRVDRHGQKSDEVHLYHFVGKGFDAAKPGKDPGDLEGDLEFLLRAVRKVETIRGDLLGKVGPVIADQVEEAMLGKRRQLDTGKAETDASAMRALLKSERKLRDRLEKLKRQVLKTQQELHITPERVLNVVETGLELAGQPRLIADSLPGLPQVWHLPHFTGSWAQCAEGLAHPHTRKIRPITFDHSQVTGRDDVVLCHLGHRLVQMCLRLLRAEVWSMETSKKLHRFTARLVPDRALDTPAVVVHGRLLVLGGDSQRIHEEVLVAGGLIEQGNLKRMSATETRDALAAAEDKAAPGFIEDTLKQLWPNLEAPLLKALDARMKECTGKLQSDLDERAESEVAKLTALMAELERDIRTTLDEKHGPQLEFAWTEAEKLQRQRDFESLRLRLKQLPTELERETAHLRGRYANPQPRLFPLAVTFLIPPRAIAALQKGGAR